MAELLCWEMDMGYHSPGTARFPAKGHVRTVRPTKEVLSTEIAKTIDGKTRRTNAEQRIAAGPPAGYD